MTSAVGPRPIAFASTISKDGQVNLSPFSFFNAFGSNPPVLVFSPVRRISNNTEKDTLHNLEETKEVVINVVNYAIVHQMSLSSADYPSDVNEFEKAGLTMQESDKVGAYRVQESPVQFECAVKEINHTGLEGGAGSLVICEVLAMHVSDEIIDSDNKIDQEGLDLVARMGGGWYSRARNGMFKIPKPQSSLGMGVDQLPDHIKNSPVLTGNALGKLATFEKAPSVAEAQKFVENSEHADLVQNSTTNKIQAVAQEYLKKDEVDVAWKILLAKKD